MSRLSELLRQYEDIKKEEQALKKRLQEINVYKSELKGLIKEPVKMGDYELAVVPRISEEIIPDKAWPILNHLEHLKDCIKITKTALFKPLKKAEQEELMYKLRLAKAIKNTTTKILKEI